MEEAVSVTAEGAALNTSDANLGFTVDAKRLAELPLIHGDPYKIMGLATGLAHSGSQRLDRPYEPTHIVGYAYDGTRSNRSDLLIDGAPSTATANAERGHRDLRPALRPRPGVQGADRDLRRPVRQHRGRRHQHQHQVRDEPPPRLGLLLRRAVQSLARERLLREGAGPGPPSRAPRTGPASPSAARSASRGSTTGGTRPSSRSATSASRTSARASTPAADSLGADRGAAQRRLLRLLVEHHDLRPADPRPQRQRAVRRPAVPGQHHPGQPDQPRGEGDPRVLLACPRTPASTATSTTRPCRRRRTTTASPAASTRRSPTATRCSPGTAGTTATASTTSTWARRRPRAPGSSSSRTRPWSTTCTSSTRRPS